MSPLQPRCDHACTNEPPKTPTRADAVALGKLRPNLGLPRPFCTFFLPTSMHNRGNSIERRAKSCVRWPLGTTKLHVHVAFSHFHANPTPTTPCPVRFRFLDRNAFFIGTFSSDRVSFGIGDAFLSKRKQTGSPRFATASDRCGGGGAVSHPTRVAPHVLLFCGPVVDGWLLLEVLDTALSLAA